MGLPLLAPLGKKPLSGLFQSPHFLSKRRRKILKNVWSWVKREESQNVRCLSPLKRPSTRRLTYLFPLVRHQIAEPVSSRSYLEIWSQIHKVHKSKELERQLKTKKDCVCRCIKIISLWPIFPKENVRPTSSVAFPSKDDPWNRYPNHGYDSKLQPNQDIWS